MGKNLGRVILFVLLASIGIGLVGCGSKSYSKEEEAKMTKEDQEHQAAAPENQ